VDTTSVVPVPDGSRRELGVRTLGDGPPLVLLNGYSGTAADWDPRFLTTLGASHTVVAPDHQGMGTSTAGDLERLTVDSMADDVLLLVDHLGAERVCVVGWSMGGMVAQSFALRHPGHVSALVLLGTDGGGPEAVVADPEVWSRLVDHSGSARDQATRLLHLLFPSEVAASVDRMFGDVVAGARAVLSPEVLAAQERAIAGWHAVDPGRPRLPVPPVLVATGSEDVVIPPANADLVAERWGADRVERFAGGGHAFMAQEPEALGTLITSFLAQSA
jgi:pimeloyl-ACP methyl ester carboxylesterase